jgi:hypothetical protein
VHSFFEHSFVARTIDSFGAGVLTHPALQLTSLTSQAARQAVVESAVALEVVLEAVLLVSLWAATRPKRATIGMKERMLFVCAGVRNECGRR